MVLQNLRYPVLFSAPASFLAIPVEGMFGAINARDFKKVEAPKVAELSKQKIKRLSNMQGLMAKVADYLLSIKQQHVKSISV